MKIHRKESDNAQTQRSPTAKFPAPFINQTCQTALCILLSIETLWGIKCEVQHPLALL